MLLGPAGIHLPGGLSDSPEKDGQRTPEGFEVRFPLAHLSVMLWCAEGDSIINFRLVVQGPHVATGMDSYYGSYIVRSRGAGRSVEALASGLFLKYPS